MIHFIVNPTAGRGRSLGVWRSLAAELERRGIPHRVDVSQHPGHAVQLAQSAAPQASTVVAVGGDGTLHEVVNGIGIRPVAVGIIPCGTGNDFARSIGIPRDPRAALERLLAGGTRTLDLGQVNGEYFVNVAGLGFDAAVAERVNGYRFWKQGAVPYVWAAVSELRRRSCVDVEISIDGGTRRQSLLLLAAVGNGGVYGGGMQICPGARPDDGRFHVCIAENLSRLQALALLPRVFFGAHVRHPGVQIVQAQTVCVTGPEDVPVHADGEIIGRLPAHFRILRNRLRFCAEGPRTA